MRKVAIPFILLVLLFLTPAFAQDVSPEAADASSADVVTDVVADTPAPVPEADPAPAPETKDEEPVVEKEEVGPQQPETDEEVGGIVGLLLQAISSGAWPVVAGLIIMLVVWVVRRFAMKTISEKWNKATPWVAAGLGVLSCVGVTLAAGTMVWWKALLDGLVSGLFASGLWELLGKHVLGKGKTEEKPAE